ncbi:hypothetical protein V8B97DRAFT_1915774 [Scleroderma yunnanense]
MTPQSSGRRGNLHGNSSTTTLSVSNKPSRRNKKDVQVAIAKHIFEQDDIYAELYVSHPNKFSTSLGNQLGIGPDANILAEICYTFPLFDDLNMIWCSIPSFDSELSSSKPNIDHAEKFLSLVQQKMPCDGDDEESHGNDADQAKHNVEGPASEKGGEGSSLNEEGIDDGMQMEFGNDNKLCFSPAWFENGDNPLMDCDEPFDGDMQMLSPHQSQKALLAAWPHDIMVPPVTFTLKHKARTLAYDSCAAFCQQSPYIQPPALSDLLQVSHPISHLIYWVSLPQRKVVPEQPHVSRHQEGLKKLEIKLK